MSFPAIETRAKFCLNWRLLLVLAATVAVDALIIKAICWAIAR